MTQTDAHKRLKGSFSKDKHEILYKDYGLNYNTVDEVYKKGTILIRMSAIGGKKEKKPPKLVPPVTEQPPLELPEEEKVGDPLA